MPPAPTHARPPLGITPHMRAPLSPLVTQGCPVIFPRAHGSHRGHSGCCASCGLDTCVLPGVRRDRGTQSSFPALRGLRARPVRPSAHHPRNCCSCYRVYGFAFPITSSRWNHRACGPTRLVLSLRGVHLRFLHVFSWLDRPSHFRAE